MRYWHRSNDDTKAFLSLFLCVLCFSTSNYISCLHAHLQGPELWCLFKTMQKVFRTHTLTKLVPLLTLADSQSASGRRRRHVVLRSCHRPNLKTRKPKLHTKGRCFSMCEPDDLLYRDDKLMKPVVAHDGIKPTRLHAWSFCVVSSKCSFLLLSGFSCTCTLPSRRSALRWANPHTSPRTLGMASWKKRRS